MRPPVQKLVAYNTVTNLASSFAETGGPQLQTLESFRGSRVFLISIEMMMQMVKKKFRFWIYKLYGLKFC